MSEINLLPCPFCGGEAELVGRRHWVRCKRCAVESGYYDNPETAIENWNTRKPMEQIVERLKKEKKIHTENYNISLYRDFPEVKRRYKQMCSVIDKAIDIVHTNGKE